MREHDCTIVFTAVSIEVCYNTTRSSGNVFTTLVRKVNIKMWFTREAGPHWLETIEVSNQCMLL